MIQPDLELQVARYKYRIDSKSAIRRRYQDLQNTDFEDCSLDDQSITPLLLQDRQLKSSGDPSDASDNDIQRPAPNAARHGEVRA
jgi:hypothetical protein